MAHDAMVKVLVVKPSSLGDIIHSTAAVATLARCGAGVEIAWVANEEYASFVRSLPGVSEVIPFPRRELRWKRFPRWVPAWMRWVAALRRHRFEVGIDLQGLQRSGLILRLSGAKERYGPGDARELAWLHYTRRVPVPEDMVHAADRVEHLVRAAIDGCERLRGGEGEGPGPGGPGPDSELRLEVPEEARAWARETTREAEATIALCPATRWESKTWPATRWVELIDRLHERWPALLPVLVGAPGEAAALDAICAQAGSPALNLAGRADLWQTAAVLERAEIAVSMDSAPLHLAARVGTPTVALFGPTDPARVAPRGDRHVVLRRDELTCLGCYRRRCPLPRRVCLPDLGAPLVVRALERRLDP